MTNYSLIWHSLH